MPWNCPNCEAKNLTATRECEVCGTNRSLGEIWICPYCEAENDKGEDACEICGTDQSQSGIMGIPASAVQTLYIEPQWYIAPGQFAKKSPRFAPTNLLRKKTLRQIKRQKIKQKIIKASGAGITSAAIMWVIMPFELAGPAALYLLPIWALISFIVYSSFEMLGLSKEILIPASLNLPVDRLPKLEGKAQLQIQQGSEASEAFTQLRFDERSKTLAILNAGNEVKIWSVTRGRLQEALIFKENKPLKLQISRKNIVGINSTGFQVWNLKGHFERKIEAYLSPQSIRVALCREGTRLLIYEPGFEGFIWDLERNDHESFELNNDFVNPNPPLDWDAEGTVLAFVPDGKGIRIWDRYYQKKVESFEGAKGTIIALACSESSRHVAALTAESRLYIWHFSSSNPLAFWDFGAHEVCKSISWSGPQRLFFPGNGKLVLADSRGNLLLVNWFKQEVLKHFVCDFSPVDLDLSPDGKWLAVCGDGGFCLWEV